MALNLYDPSLAPETRGIYRYTEGHKAEDDFIKAAEKLGIKVVPHEMVGKEIDYYAVCKATEEEDAGGVDIHLHVPGKGWFEVDITTSRNPENQRRKRDKKDKAGIIYMPFRAQTLDNAARGTERDLDLVEKDLASHLESYFTPDRGPESQEAKAQPSKQPLPA